MLTQTFLHVPGIGRETERGLWEQGCATWDDYLAAPDRWSVGSASHELTRTTLAASVDALAQRRHQYFEQALGASEAWRAWPEFRDACVYLDIETDGTPRGDAVTTIGLWDGREFTVLVKGRDLENFRDVISRYSMIVTFFGGGFDLPMLRKRFPGIVFDQIHLDLCPTFRKIGVRGGLKRIEKQFGLSRADDTDGLSGLDAIRLWREYQRGREASLETLIAYNREDVVNLEALAEIAYGRLRASLRGPA